MDNKRSFTVTKVVTAGGRSKGRSNLGGRYLSSTPANAAKKAGSQICRASRIKGQCSLIIHLRETTQNSAHKDYVYKVRRVHDPVTVERAGEEITYNYKMSVKSMN
jgi:hypothetical protein